MRDILHGRVGYNRNVERGHGLEGEKKGERRERERGTHVLSWIYLTRRREKEGESSAYANR
jgi:hypothetical protein